MQFDLAKLKGILVEPGYISEEDFNISSNEAQLEKKDLSDILIQKDLIKDSQLGELIAQDIGVKFINLRNEKIEVAALSILPESVARSKGLIVIREDEKFIHVGMLNPLDMEAKHLAEKKTGKKAQVYLVTSNDFQEALTNYTINIEEDLRHLLTVVNNDQLSRDERDEAIVKIVNLILLYGYYSKSSDIHIEPYAQKTLVRFRIDGIMHDIIDIPKNLYDLVLTRLKIMAKMRIDEHRSALDGKLKFNAPDESIDVRVSIIPVTEGENVVMRLLTEKTRQFSLSDLGFGEQELLVVKKGIEQPHGMIVVTGPTGSGKTTTVYALMKIINTRDIHISTIEDPVEYEIQGVSQIQVNAKTNLTFADGLRSIVRQDPDIIMVGEIRDNETAGISVNAAMTGHLVLTTVHANDSATTLPRLLDMGVEPYLVASTINAIIAQRLVRHICPRCRFSYQLKADEVSKIDLKIKDIFKSMRKEKIEDIYFYKGAGCALCRQTGFSGRIGIFEVLTISKNIEALILKRSSSAEIMEEAKKEGMRTMFEDGIEKVLNGITTLDEIIKAAKE